MQALEGATTCWRTPPVACGLLAGVMREELLRTGVIHTGCISLGELGAALRAGRRLMGFNSVRGQYLLQLAEPDLLRLEALESIEAGAERPRVCTPASLDAPPMGTELNTA